MAVRLSAKAERDKGSHWLPAVQTVWESTGIHYLLSTTWCSALSAGRCVGALGDDRLRPRGSVSESAPLVTSPFRLVVAPPPLLDLNYLYVPLKSISAVISDDGCLQSMAIRDSGYGVSWLE